jgi:hypothetical protein
MSVTIPLVEEVLSVVEKAVEFHHSTISCICGY